MISNIRNAFMTMMQQASWMDDESKKKAINKAKAIFENIGYPDYLASDNTTQLEKMYAEVRISFVEENECLWYSYCFSISLIRHTFAMF
jgi:predicted metalloendopeptidase